jgi:hypothetical protein
VRSPFLRLQIETAPLHENLHYFAVIAMISGPVRSMTCLKSNAPIKLNFQFECNITGIVRNRSAIRYGYRSESTAGGSAPRQIRHTAVSVQVGSLLNAS